MVKKKEKKLKTFNLSGVNYEKFSEYCKSEGISMSRKVDKFISEELERLGLHLEVEKDVSVRPEGEGSETVVNQEGVVEDEKEHSFQKYC